MIQLPSTVHWLELVSAIISGLGTVVLLIGAWVAGADRRAIPIYRRIVLTPVARYAVEASWLKALAEAIFFGLSLRAMTLGPATTTAQGAPDIGAMLSTAGLVSIEIILLVLGLRNVQMRREVRIMAAQPYVGPDRRQSEMPDGQDG